MKIIDQLWDRIESDKEDSDSSHFYSLMYLGELVTKLTAVGLLSAVGDDRNRSRYEQLHTLVRATGVGQWAEVIDATLTGPAAQFLDPAAYAEQRELIQHVAKESWQFQAVERMNQALEVIGQAQLPLPRKVQGKQWFHAYATLRNKTRGHGALPPTIMGALCEELSNSLHLVTDNSTLFQRSWAYLHRNLSGKYRVYEISGDCKCFEDFRKSNELDYENGLYIGFDNKICRVQLIEVNPSITDFYVANGGFNGARYDLLSYGTGDCVSASATPYTQSPGALPESKTHGSRPLEVVGEALSNVPPPSRDYVDRLDLQHQMLELLQDDRHPVITLIGRGGIGKTALTLATIPELAKTNRFDVIAWFSARDIDLLPSGPKPVRPDVLTAEDIAREFAKLMGATDSKSKNFDPREYMNAALGKSANIRTLFVFDNFETITNLADTYSWLDNHIRDPNKILITTRTRDFRGDFPLEIGGMTEDQCNQLIDKVARRYGVASQITKSYRQDLFRESGGHPYVIKMLLGGIERGKPLRSVHRILAGQEDILPALFERTYKSLTPQAQRLFLTIANWNSTIPFVGLQCVLLRDANEKMDIDSALSELERSSLVETAVSGTDNNLFVSVPIAAQVFGKRQLNVSPYRAAVMADTELLRNFGAGSVSGVKKGIGPHVQRFVRTLAKDVLEEKRKLDEVEPLLRFLARRDQDAWLLIADLYEELQVAKWIERTKDALREYLAALSAGTVVTTEAATPVWKRLANSCRESNDTIGELNAWIGLARMPYQRKYEIANAANKFNRILAEHSQQILKDEKNILATELIDLMSEHRAHATATELSRLAWLCLHIGKEQDAMAYVNAGLEKDPENTYCRRLAEKLGLRLPN